MDLKQLEYFRQVAELGSFSRASTFLDVAQPALSRQVRALEVELHVTLFERNGRGVIMTDSGKRLLEHCRDILQLVEQAKRHVSEQRDVAEGTLVLGLPAVLSRTMTVPLVEAFHQHFPHSILRTIEGLSVYIPEWLTIGRLDCAVIYNATPMPNIELAPLAQESLYLISQGPKQPTGSAVGPAISLREAAELPLIVPGRPHTLGLFLEAAMHSVGRKLNVIHEVESIPAIVDLVRHGHGYAILPLNALDTSQRRWNEDLFVCPIVEPPLICDLWMATSAHRPDSPLIKKALEVVRTVLLRQLALRSANILSVLQSSEANEARHELTPGLQRLA